jgi:hypothetical protein
MCMSSDESCLTTLKLSRTHVSLIILNNFCLYKPRWISVTRTVAIHVVACCTARLSPIAFVNFFLFLVWWDWVSWYCAHYWPIVPAPDDRWWWLWRNWWNEDWQGKLKYSEKTCPSATLSTTNPIWLDPGHRCGKPATNRLSYGAALF